MKILLGICGLGNAHSVRQFAMIEELVKRGAKLAIFCGAKSLEFMQRYNPYRIPFQEVDMFAFFADNNGLNWERIEKLQTNSWARKNRMAQEAFKAVPAMLGGQPDLCLSDYEPETARYAYQNNIPLITFDEGSKFLGYQTEEVRGYTRMEHRSRLSYFFPTALARYVISFDTVEVEKDEEYTVELFPAPLRLELEQTLREHPPLTREAKDGPTKVLVYLSPHSPPKQKLEEIIAIFASYKEQRFTIYSDFGNIAPQHWARQNHLFFKSFDKDAFIHDLVATDCVISTAGHTLLSEAAYLSLPIYAVPLEPYDQQYSAAVIERYGVGIGDPEISRQQLDRFFSNLSHFKANFATRAKFRIEKGVMAQVAEKIWRMAKDKS